jgi:hypothetical protein
MVRKQERLLQMVSSGRIFELLELDQQTRCGIRTGRIELIQ